MADCATRVRTARECPRSAGCGRSAVEGGDHGDIPAGWIGGLVSFSSVTCVLHHATTGIKIGTTSISETGVGLSSSATNDGFPVVVDSALLDDRRQQQLICGNHTYLYGASLETQPSGRDRTSAGLVVQHRVARHGGCQCGRPLGRGRWRVTEQDDEEKTEERYQVAVILLLRVHH